MRTVTGFLYVVKKLRIPLYLKSKYSVILLFILLTGASSLWAQQSSSDKSDMQSLLNSKQYSFTAQYAQPMSGRQVNLTSLYMLTLRNDTLLCDLPYYGVAYVAPAYGSTEGGLHFVSHHFEYTVYPQKKGRYMVGIKFKDRSDVQQMYLNVSKKGYATLQVTPTNKQAISYYGTVDQNKK